MISSLRPLEFFDAGVVGKSLSYVTGYPALEKDKLKGLLGLLKKMVRDHDASFLVIDGFVMLGSAAESDVETKKFVHELQVFVELVGCTTLVLTGTTNGDEPYPLRTMVDGLLELRLGAVGMEAARTLEIPKFRGDGVLLGRHLFEISGAGVTIYPRTESLRGRALPSPAAAEGPPSAFDIPGLDAMLAGGVSPSSVTMLLGAPGSGKTLLGLSFLAAGAARGDSAVYFGFFETPADVSRRADGIGIGLSRHVESGLVQTMWRSPLDALADHLAEEILVAVRDRGVKRLFIDGIGGLRDALVYPDRTRRFFAALCSELRSLGVVTVLSDQTRHLTEIEFPEPGITALLDNVICIRHVEREGRSSKLLSILKMRERGGDWSTRRLSIGAHGIVVDPSEAALSSAPSRKPRAVVASKRSAAKGRPRRSR